MIGLRIAALRKRAGLSQRELGQRLGVSASAVGMYEQGRREPSAEKLVRLAEILEVTVDYLLTGEPTARDRAALTDLARRAMDRAALAGLVLRTGDGVERPVSQADMTMVLAALLGEAKSP